MSNEIVRAQELEEQGVPVDVDLGQTSFPYATSFFDKAAKSGNSLTVETPVPQSVGDQPNYIVPPGTTLWNQMRRLCGYYSSPAPNSAKKAVYYASSNPNATLKAWGYHGTRLS
jgi:hypothetical protein